jgi:hypothetical protein
VDPSACGSDQDCSGFGYAWSCSAHTCVPPECTDDSVCGNFRCANHHCWTDCTDASQCQAGFSCIAGACAIKTCQATKTGQCDGFRCKGGVCPMSCTGSAECEGTLLCLSGTCQCDPSGSGCDGFACLGGRCLTSCSADGDCAAGKSCYFGRCVECVGTPAPCASQSYPDCGDGCTSDNGCTGGAIDCASFNGDANAGVCALQTGCTYSYATHLCTGSSRCDLFSPGNCHDHPTCQVQIVCMGQSTAACAGRTPADCRKLSGCSLL